MVAKIISGKYIKGMLRYNEQKVEGGLARLILAGGFAMDVQKLDMAAKLRRFENRTMLNPRARTNAIHISLNFHAADDLNDSKLQQIALDYIERIGFGEQPFLVYRHLDTGHPHVHIATTNITLEGRRIDIHNLGRGLSEQTRKELEIEHGLVRAQESKLNQQEPWPIWRASYGRVPTKKQLDSITAMVFQQYSFGSFAEYHAILNQLGVNVDTGTEGSRMKENKGLVYSIVDHLGKPVGVSFKASALGTRPTLLRIEKKFAGNIARRKRLSAEIKNKVLDLLGTYQQLTKNTFIAELAKQQLHAVFITNREGLTYGVTFIDHGLRCAVKGSDLGRELSARALSDRFGTMDVKRTYLHHSPVADRPWPAAKQQGSGQPFILEDLLSRNNEGEQMPKMRKRKRRRKGPDQELGR